MESKKSFVILVKAPVGLRTPMNKNRTDFKRFGSVEADRMIERYKGVGWECQKVKLEI